LKVFIFKSGKALGKVAGLIALCTDLNLPAEAQSTDE
jgi:hypothetical protein